MATAKKLPSGSYRIRVFDNRINKYKSFTAPTKREAERMANEYLDTSLQEGTPTFKQAAEEYINIKSTTLSPTTVHEYTRTLNTATGRINDMLLTDINVKVLQDWINEMSMTKSPKTVRNYFGFATAVLMYNDIIINRRKIMLPQKTRKFKRLPTPEEVVSSVKGTDIELPVMLGMWLGMRMSEIRGIKKSDIDGNILSINRVRVYVDGKFVEKKCAKTYKSNRQLRLPPQILSLINETEECADGFLIGGGKNTIYKKFEKVMESMGYNITFHDLRHINASVMAFLNIPDIYAMERGGWSNTSTLKGVYQQTFDSQRISIDNKIDSYFSEVYDTKYDTKNENKRKYVG